MILPKTNQLVKIIFATGISLEGTVISWSDQQAVIQTDEEDCQIIINKPVDNILAVKVYGSPKAVKEDKPTPVIKQEILEGLKNPNREDFTKHTLPALAAELKAQELREFVEPLRSHQIGNTQRPNYAIPNFIPVQRPEQHPAEENSGEVKSGNSGLSRLFQKRR